MMIRILIFLVLPKTICVKAITRQARGPLLAVNVLIISVMMVADSLAHTERRKTEIEHFTIFYT